MQVLLPIVPFSVAAWDVCEQRWFLNLHTKSIGLSNSGLGWLSENSLLNLLDRLQPDVIEGWMPDVYANW
jgi:hypothetical protein